jgi:hypothetical protein
MVWLERLGNFKKIQWLQLKFKHGNGQWDIFIQSRPTCVSESVQAPTERGLLGYYRNQTCDGSSSYVTLNIALCLSILADLANSEIFSPHVHK